MLTDIYMTNNMQWKNMINDLEKQLDNIQKKSDEAIFESTVA